MTITINATINVNFSNTANENGKTAIEVSGAPKALVDLLRGMGVEVSANENATAPVVSKASEGIVNVATANEHRYRHVAEVTDDCGKVTECEEYCTHLSSGLEDYGQGFFVSESGRVLSNVPKVSHSIWDIAIAVIECELQDTACAMDLADADTRATIVRKIKKALRENKNVYFTYEKKSDGTTRKANGTTHPDILGEFDHKGNKREFSEYSYLIPYFDLWREDWRCFDLRYLLDEFGRKVFGRIL